jgi:hypothetical protein
VEAGQQYYEERYRERVVQSLTKRAQTLGFQPIPTAEAA